MMHVSAQVLNQPGSPAAFLGSYPDRSRDTQIALPAPFGRGMLEAFDRLGFGSIVFDARGSLLVCNSVALDLLQHKIGGAVTLNNPDWLQHAARRLLQRGTPLFSEDGDAWGSLPCSMDRPLAINRIQLFQSDGSGFVILILADLSAAAQPSPRALRRMFGLTETEATLAIQIAHGDRPSKIARDRGVSVATVRSQLASVFSKTQTRRQSELAILVTRVAILP